MEFYDPNEIGIDELVKRVRVGEKTKEFISSATGKAIVSRAVSDYRSGIHELQKMIMDGWTGSQEQELSKYRGISNNLATPLKMLRWLDGVIADGDNAETLAKYKRSSDLEP
jgi:hypothetical protein